MNRGFLKIVRHVLQASCGLVCYGLVAHHAMHWHSGVEGLAHLLYALFWLMCAFAFSLSYFGDAALALAPTGLFFNEGAIVVRRDYSEVKAMIHAGHYRAAADRLEVELEENLDPAGVLLLANLQLDYLHDPVAAAMVAARPLNQKKWIEEHCQLLNVVVDQLLAEGDREKAAGWLAIGIEKAPDPALKNGCRARWQALQNG